MYTAEQLMPKRYPENRPIKNSSYWCFSNNFDMWVLYFSCRGCFDGLHENELIKWFIDIPGAPEEVKPLAYPEHEPEKDGRYIAHNKDTDIWEEMEYRESWQYIMHSAWGIVGIDYFIPIRLDEPFGNSEKLECTGIPILISSTLFAVEEFDNTISISDSPEEPGGISVDCDEFTVLTKRWLDQQGYDVIKREPEIAPCPNPECVIDQLELEDCVVADAYRFYLYCHKCDYSSPLSKTKTEAIRLHNLIAGRGESQNMTQKEYDERNTNPYDANIMAGRK